MQEECQRNQEEIENSRKWSEKKQGKALRPGNEREMGIERQIIL